MLNAKLIDRIVAAENPIAADRSRCLRMRFNGNSCTRCSAVCLSGAITINEDVSIDADVCSACLQCVAACPMDCFTVPEDNFSSIIRRLQKARTTVTIPVLGCRTSEDTVGHAKIHCFGSLSAEHLIALAAFLEEGLQLDGTKCADCRNGFILEPLKERIIDVRAWISQGCSDRLKLIEDVAELDYREPSCDRRGFFSALKLMTFMQAADLLEKNHSGAALHPYSLKKVPLKRELLNWALKTMPEELRKPLLDNYFYLVRVDEDCNLCFSCTGVCPTGALSIGKKDEPRSLLFSSYRCNDCGLCESFCRKGCVSIGKGFSGEDPFKFITAKGRRKNYA